MKKKKVNAIKMYFADTPTDTFLMDRISNIADGLGLSMSDTAGMILRAGVEQVEKKVVEMIGDKKDDTTKKKTK